MLKQELRLTFARPLPWLCMLAFVACLEGSSLPIWIIRCQQGDRALMSAMDLTFTPVFFGGIMLLVPLCAAAAYGAVHAEELRTRFFLFEMKRTSERKYVLTKALSAMLTGALVLGGGFLLHVILWHIVAGPYDVAARPDIAVDFVPGTVYNTYIQTPYAIMAYVHAVLGFAVTGALWAMVAVTLLVWNKDPQLSVALTVVIYYLMRNRFVELILGIRMPSYTGLYNDGQLWADYFQSLGFHLVLLAALTAVYGWGIRRCEERG